MVRNTEIQTKKKRKTTGRNTVGNIHEKESTREREKEIETDIFFLQNRQDQQKMSENSAKNQDGVPRCGFVGCC